MVNELEKFKNICTVKVEMNGKKGIKGLVEFNLDGLDIPTSIFAIIVASLELEMYAKDNIDRIISMNPNTKKLIEEMRVLRQGDIEIIPTDNNMGKGH